MVRDQRFLHRTPRQRTPPHTSELLCGLRIHPPKVHPVRGREWGPHARSELYLNFRARARISQYIGISKDRLARALPCWTEHRDRGAAGRSGAGGVIRPFSLPAVIGCPHCTITRTGHTQPVPRYIPHHRLVCARHHTWALGPHTLNGIPVPHTHALLHQTPEIIRAHHTHQRLAREAITYPETIALAGLLIRKPSTRYHQTRPGQPHPLHTTIARLLNRRWLQNPAHYPEDLSRYIHSAPRHPTNDTAYRHHTKPTSREGHSVELTQLGYRPPRPHTNNQ
ncbi:hypothetical protein ACFZBM_38015 [Streptomyces lavendulae]|uniref:hypothetical protein n=1 Tax=Streptomyces lavendulae TaxID=1914 RepID=UPI0036E2276D